MQTITLLVSIAEAAASPDPRVAEQIPEGLRFSRTLLLCPPGLIQNWMDEWQTWKPRDTVNVGKIYEVASKPLQHRIQDIQEWHESGGVLILGYETVSSLWLSLLC
jgi:SNF2 family DNA or RNA helicase